MKKLMVILTLVLGTLLVFVSVAKAESHPGKKPQSVIEFSIGKHGNLHTVLGGFQVKRRVFKKRENGKIFGLKVVVNINSLWTWQGDASASDNPKRTADLLSNSWFDAKRYPIAVARAKVLNLQEGSTSTIKLTIKERTKEIKVRVEKGFLKFRIKLSDFNIDNSWKRVFASGYADVKVELNSRTPGF